MVKKLIILCASMLTSCSLAPETIVPQVSTPAAWDHVPEAVGEVPALDPTWWANFGSKNLPGIVAAARAANPDLEAAQARIAQAQAQAKLAGASLYPTLGGQGDLERSYNSRGVAGKSSAQTGYSGGLVASYELDLFGKNRDTQASAEASEQASHYDHAALALSITAQTAQAYITLLALEARVAIAQQNLNTAQDTLTTLRTRYQAGAISPLELATQENFVHTSDAALQALLQQQEAGRNALAVLMGQPPETLRLTQETLANIAAPNVPLAMPAAWLAQRPDIARAEEELRAANFDIGVARAAFYPSLTLSASSLLSATPLSDPSASINTLTAGLTAPLFKGGALDAGLEKATARQQELAASYRKTVLQAFEDAENALDGVNKQQARRGALTRAVAAAQTAYDATQVRFAAGAIDTLTLLDAERSLLSAQDALAQARAASLNAAIDLYRAMGGGWKKDK